MITKTIDSDIIIAMKSKDSLALRTLRSVKNEISNTALRSGNIANEVDDVTALAVIRKCIVQREQSIAEFTKGSRLDLVEAEEKEKEILNKYLPAAITSEELAEIVSNVINTFENIAKKDTKIVIGKVMAIVAGRADNKSVSAAVIAKMP